MDNTCSPGLEPHLPAIPWTAPPSVAEARAAFAEAARLRAAQKPIDALLQLRIVEAAFPSLGDRLALLRGDLLLESHQPETACEAYLAGSESLDRNVAASARVGYVRCGLAMDAGDADDRLDTLLRRYPRHPERDGLRLLLARHLERTGDREGAIELYRSIDLRSPGTRAAREARTALSALTALGVEVAPLSPEEATARAERLARSGPFPEARSTIAALLSREDFPDSHRGRLELMAARLARMEGRWQAATDAARKAQALGVSAGAAARYVPPEPPQRVQSPEQAGLQVETDERIKAILGNRRLDRASNTQLRRALETATHYGMKDQASAVLEAMAGRRSYYPAGRFDAALSAMGVAEDTAVARLLATIVDLRRYQVSGRYHYARALERMGDLDRAIEQYEKVLSLDESHTPYYSMWAEQRLWAIRSHYRRSCVPALPHLTDWDEFSATRTGLCDPDAPEPPEITAGDAFDPIALPGALEHDGQGENPELRGRVLGLLEPLVERHGDAYPWFSRARDLVLLDRFYDAADELSEAYLAYRDARGSPRLRAGLEAVLSGSLPPRWSCSGATRRGRVALSQDDRQHLATLAAWLGDHGTAVRFAGYDVDERPRAYAPLVRAAAERHGIDPDLLFAVMRVESIYHKQVISHVGAIGLTQIMPRTGRLIAHSLEVTDFEVPDLLDPKTNLNFSAWYLASLIRRFDGHLPLAIASYNGGPHNVRLWLRATPRTMPLDAFLEHIPFTETHRYVRRVLTHYAAYRAQRNLPMPRLALRLPQTGPDLMAF